ncbi:MAG: SCP2 sterol-binding domain-containing protein [Ilumatobacter sp.]|uniref:SCP2 sterol-binding domain-containing protein n=1 Tax=Ilumatobacter sp. TaxID=1967498 RepID=UPI003C77D020
MSTVVPHMAYPFLSQEWMDAARAIREQHADEVPDVAADLRINVAVTDVPFDDETVNAFLDTTSGAVVMELGELDEPDVTVTTDYPTAQALFVDQDPAIAMQSFMNGKIKVQGDMMKLMAMQTSLPSNEASEKIAQEIKDITQRPPETATD